MSSDFFLLLVSSDDDLIVLAGDYCQRCVEEKLGVRVLRCWKHTSVTIKEFLKEGVRAVRIKGCSC